MKEFGQALLDHPQLMIAWQGLVFLVTIVLCVVIDAVGVKRNWWT